MSQAPHPDPTAERSDPVRPGTDGHTPALPYARATATVLDPSAVRNQVFTVVRLREGYDLAEVDEFLAQVEISLGVLLRENAELRARPGADARSKADSARIVALAQETAGRAIAGAQQEAERITREAREQAEALRAQALDQVEREREALDLGRRELARRLDSVNRSASEYRDRVADALAAQVTQIRSLLTDLTELEAGWHLSLDETPPPRVAAPRPPSDPTP
ncbi:DivIVA domain-containing protein [Nonomuraea jiangxiensis]|uniref:Cell wall synthesis protein Wag31 n=1 Tax=Nonomuraea jiangxiensis TaxID=633440 RepID=A0A1G7ZN55_9ACTN|nr:DivIVA domain-containing protein [Nonomuraea jiangxiensis]SDH10079.1 DivIVA domain-containing protein [Nonomuraea jiangxiensis]